MLEEHGSSRSTRSSRLARLARQSRTCRVESSRAKWNLSQSGFRVVQDPGGCSMWMHWQWRKRGGRTSSFSLTEVLMGR